MRTRARTRAFIQMADQLSDLDEIEKAVLRSYKNATLPPYTPHKVKYGTIQIRNLASLRPPKYAF